MQPGLLRLRLPSYIFQRFGPFRSFTLIKKGNEAAGSMAPIAGLASANTAVILGAVLNTGLAGSKGYIGLAIGSTALVADAANSIGDVLCDAVVYYSLNAARSKPTVTEPWGRGKLEPLGALSVGVLLICTGGGVCYSALASALEVLLSSGDIQAAAGFVSPPIADLANPRRAAELFAEGSLLTYSALAISAASIVSKEALFRYTLRAGEQAKSDAVIANAHQHRSDVLLSSSVLAGLFGSMVGFPLLDPLAGLLVSGVILNQGVRTVFTAVRGLIDSPADPIEVALLENTCLHVPGVRSIVSLTARKSGPFLYVDCAVGVDGAMSATAAHGVAEAVRFTLRKMHGERVADAAVRPVPAAQDETAESRERRESRGRATALAAQSLLDISEITRVVDVILEDDRDVAVSVCMGTELTIGTARDVCVKAERSLAAALPWAKTVRIRLDLHTPEGEHSKLSRCNNAEHTASAN